jgi:processive 1,2-diacylglycerol beta-glucosyltransferase
MKHRNGETILILSGNYGDGHLQAANAIQQAMRISRPDVNTVVIDFMAWNHPYTHPISRYLYMRGIQKFPSVYGYLFQKTRDTHSSGFLKTFTWIGMKRMLKLLQEVQPSVVVSTFPFAAAALSRLKAYGLIDVPTVTVITDHTDHSYWIHAHTDHYIVGSDYVRQGLRRAGIDDRQIAVTGIPVRPEFSRTYSKELLKTEHGLDPDLPTVLVIGGGQGMFGDGVQSLEQMPVRLQLIVVCGHNQKLLHKLSEYAERSKHRILLTGYITYIHELMIVSDLIITKPGGLTTSEAIALEVPMLFYKPLPGQEQDNARFLLQAGVALQARNGQELRDVLTEVLRNPHLLREMRRQARHLQTKWAAFDALEIIMQAMRRSKRYGQKGVHEIS